MININFNKERLLVLNIEYYEITSVFDDRHIYSLIPHSNV